MVTEGVGSPIDQESPLSTSEQALSQSSAIPWFVWCSVLAVTSAMVGVHWDIAWHRSIGRDTFWTPPHMAIYLCGILAGISSGYLILSTTFGGRRTERGAAVGMWGFRGPLGAFIAAWGGVAMLTSAPFDDWWHGAYGLDVKIISPPHALLALGMFTVELGSLILILGYMNRASAATQKRLAGLFLYVGGMIVVCLTMFIMERTDRVQMHNGEFYRDVALALPLVLIGVSRAAPHRWSATIIAAIYSLFLIGLLWILPLFPAEPKLGPVYYKVTHMVPPEFPLLLIVPALALDLVRRRTDGWSRWQEALAAGAAYFFTFLLVQWPFAVFLQSPYSRNWVFGTHYFDYTTRSYAYDFNFRFEPTTPGQQLMGLATALVLSLGTAWLAIGWSDWMRQIRR
jgi:hypothetical protein